MSDITDEMIAAAAARLRVWQPSLMLPMSSSAENIVRDLLEAALAGRMVFGQPELIEIPKFQGCPNSNPDLCACGESAICCAACGDDIEDSARAYTFRFIGCPWEADNSPEQEWGDIFWHESCDNRSVSRTPSGVAGGGVR
jgi:hypothetical protein